MHRRHHVRARIMREMLRGLADGPTAVAEPPKAAEQQAAQSVAPPAGRWWRVGKLFRRQEPGHKVGWQKS